MENSQPESLVGVSSVVVDISKRITNGADVHSGGRSIGVFLDFIPHSVEISSCGSVSIVVVGGVGDPEGSD